MTCSRVGSVHAVCGLDGAHACVSQHKLVQLQETQQQVGHYSQFRIFLILSGSVEVGTPEKTTNPFADVFIQPSDDSLRKYHLVGV